MEIMTEADANDMCPDDDLPHIGMFGFSDSVFFVFSCFIDVLCE